jgi:hypothetical protein
VWERFGLHISGNTVPLTHIGTLYFACLCVGMLFLHVSGNTVPPMHVGAIYFGCLCVWNALIYMSLGAL